MDVKEAINTLDDLKQIVKECRAYRDTGLTPEEIRENSTSFAQDRAWFIGRMIEIENDRDQWKAEAIKAMAQLGEMKLPKLAEYIEPFTQVGKFKCPSCGEMYDACYDEETGEPKIWFNHCPECGQFVTAKD